VITDRVAHFIAEIESKDIPEEAYKIARMAIMDLIGVALAGSREDTGNIIADCIQEMGGKASSTVIGKGFKTAPHLAALANGTMGHALDYDDLSFTYGAHPSCTLVPVVLSLGENIQASGKDILAAYIVGFEACAYISSPIVNSHYMQGWHSTGNIGILGSTAAAAKLLKLNVTQIKRAYGIAASTASGIRYNFGTMTKPFHAGGAASNGILAASLAQKGFTAREDIIEAPNGYARIFGCNEKIDWEKAAANLGKVFVLAKSGIGFKPYPSCGGTLGVTDATIYLRNQYQIDPAGVERITLGVGPFENRTLIHNPVKGLEGKFSLEYCSCRGLLDGKLGLRDFTDERVNQPEVHRLLNRTKCEEIYPMAVMGTDASGLNPQSVNIKMKDGHSYFRETPIIGGMPVAPMTEEQIENKYRDCASAVLIKNEIDESLSMLRALPDLDNIHELMKMIGGKVKL
jgi:2-methylcitrate dehydratase PrpD